MSTRIKLFQLLPCVLLALFIAASPSVADTTLHSSTALESIFQQTENTYLKALGTNQHETLNQAPDAFASLVGLTMQQQFKQLQEDKNRKYLSRYKVLEAEALTYMGQLAKAHNYRHPSDGSNMPASRLKVEFYNGLNMDTSKVRFGNLNPNDVKLPFVLAQVPAPKKTGSDDRWLGKMQVQDNGIKLLEEDIVGAENTNYDPLVVRDGVPEDAIIGTWVPSESRRHLSVKDGPITIRKQGTNYIGQFSYLYTKFTNRPNGIRVTTTYNIYSSAPGRSLTNELQRDYQLTYTSKCTPYYKCGLCDKPGESTKGVMKVWYDPKKQRYHTPYLSGSIIADYFKR